MKKHHYIILIVALLTGIFCTSSSCHHKKKVTYCSGSGTCRSVLEAKDFFLFKQGTWWVYEEENTHQRDSQYVYEYTNTSGYDFHVSVHSTLNDYNYRFWPTYASGAIDCSETEPISGHCLFVKRDKGKPQNFVGEADCFFFNYSFGDFAYTYSSIIGQDNKITIVDIQNSYTIDTNVYLGVVKVHEDYSQIENHQPTNHYYSKYIGLIRKELLDSNQVWNLVDYHVEQ